MNRRAKAGRMVQTVSTVWASRMFRQDSVCRIRANRAYPTNVVTKVRTNIAWS